MKYLVVSNAVAALAFAGTAFADAPNGYNRTHMYGTDGFGMILGPMFMLVFLAALVVGIIALVRWMSPSTGASDDNGTKARNALDLRFANGDIDAKEYAERKNLLAV